MNENELIRCRVAACRETLDDGKVWSFYLLNDNDFSLDEVVLCEVGYEWGDFGNSESTDVRVTSIAPGGHALIWRDDGSGAELRMDLTLRVQLRDRMTRMQFEFPKLYRKKNLPLVEGINKPGWQESAQAIIG